MKSNAAKPSAPLELGKGSVRPARISWSATKRLPMRAFALSRRVVLPLAWQERFELWRSRRDYERATAAARLSLAGDEKRERLRSLEDEYTFEARAIDDEFSRLHSRKTKNLALWYRVRLPPYPTPAAGEDWHSAENEWWTRSSVDRQLILTEDGIELVREGVDKERSRRRGRWSTFLQVLTAVAATVAAAGALLDWRNR